MKHRRIFGITFGIIMIIFGLFAPYFDGVAKIAVVAVMGACGAATATLSAFGLMFCKKTSFFGAGMAAFGVMTVICTLGLLLCGLGGISMYPVRIPAYSAGMLFGFAGFLTMAFLYAVHRAKSPGFVKVLGDAAASLMLVPAFMIIESVALTFLESAL